MSKAEKITKHTGPSKGKGSARSFVKRLTVRRSRRLGKELLDDAPRCVTKGWAD